MTDRLKATGEIEFERTAITSGGDRAGEVEVEQAWLEYGINEYFNPRAGVMLVPFGRYNLEHFDSLRDLTDRPIIQRRIIPTTWAEAGAGFAGATNLGDTSVGYQFYVFNGLTDDISDRGFRNSRGAFGQDSNGDKAFAGRVNFSPIAGIDIGLSGYRGSYDDASEHAITGFDVDWKLVWKDFEFIGEYAHFSLEPGLNEAGLAVPEKLYGYYLQGNYHFWPTFLNDSFLGRGFDNPTFTAAVRYGMAHIDDDGDAGTGDNEESRLTFGLNYRPVESFVFKFEYQFNDSTNESLERGDRNGFITSVTAAF